MRKQAKKLGQTSHGFSLVEVMVAAAIFGLAVMVWMALSGQSLKLNQSIRNASEEDEISSFVLNSLSCPNTFDPPGATPPQCAAKGDPVKLYDFQGNLFVDTPWSIFGKKYALRARCDDLGGPVTPASLAIIVESLRLNQATGKPAEDPLRPGKIETWKPVFTPGLSPCPSSKLAQPEYVTVTSDLGVDPAALITVMIWAANGGHGPVTVCADSYPDLWEAETSLVYEGAAACPRGYSVITGGVDCSMSMGPIGAPDFAPVTSPTAVRRRGWKTNSSYMHKADLPAWLQLLNAEVAQASTNTDIWFGGCCVAVNVVSSTPIPIPLVPFGTDLSDRVWARCKRDMPM